MQLLVTGELVNHRMGISQSFEAILALDRRVNVSNERRMAVDPIVCGGIAYKWKDAIGRRQKIWCLSTVHCPTDLSLC